MAQLPEFERSYSHVLLFPPQPAQMLQLEGRQVNFSARMYGIYLEEMRGLIAADGIIHVSFLKWHRQREYDSESRTCVFRGGGKHARKPLVVACRYWYELTDGFWGQFVLTQIPHLHAADILPQSIRYLQVMQNFAGMIEYLMSWVWASPGCIRARGGAVFSINALPLLIDDEGTIVPPGSYECEASVFRNAHGAY